MENTSVNIPQMLCRRSFAITSVGLCPLFHVEEAATQTVYSTNVVREPSFPLVPSHSPKMDMDLNSYVKFAFQDFRNGQATGIWFLLLYVARV